MLRSYLIRIQRRYYIGLVCLAERNISVPDIFPSARIGYIIIIEWERTLRSELSLINSTRIAIVIEIGSY